MAKLSIKQRKGLPTKDFAGPGRSFPIPDKAHAANAKARATQQENRGNLTAGQANTIKARADKVIDGRNGPNKDGGKPHH